MRDRLTLVTIIVALLAGCVIHDPDEPGNLVSRTVAEDPSLPAEEINGARLHVETQGDPTRPVIVFVHGGPGSDYRSLTALRALADQYFLVYFQPRFFIDVEASLVHTPLTYLVHSDRFRDSQYAEVVDGWYSGTGGRLSLAIEGGYRVNARWELAVRAGRSTTLELHAPQGLAYFADVVVTRHF